MSILLNILVSAAIALITTVGAYNYTPLSFIEKFGPVQEQKFGTTITTILGTDTLSGSRGVINTNFSNLDRDKVEVGTTSVASITTLENLVSIGTITTGTWNGTTLTVVKGGTGSTTLSSDQVLLGNGTTMLKTVTGFGTSGQFLTSQGVGTAPTWTTSAIDLAGNYNWTGLHRFGNNTTFQSTTTITYATTTINGVEIGWPSGGPAATTTIASSSPMFLAGVNVGSTTAQMSWAYPDWNIIGEFTISTASNTVTISNFPARQHLKIIIQNLGNSAIAGKSNLGFTSLQFNLDTAANYAYQFSRNSAAGAASTTKPMIGIDETNNSGGGSCWVDITNHPIEPKYLTWNCTSGNSPPSTAPDMIEGSGTWNNSSVQITSVTVRACNNNFDSGSKITVYGSKN